FDLIENVSRKTRSRKHQQNQKSFHSVSVSPASHRAELVAVRINRRPSDGVKSCVRFDSTRAMHAVIERWLIRHRLLSKVKNGRLRQGRGLVSRHQAIHEQRIVETLLTF